MTGVVACSTNLFVIGAEHHRAGTSPCPFQGGAPIHVGDHAGMPTGAFGLPFPPN